MATEAPVATEADGLAKPLHFQRVENALRLEPLLQYVENTINKQPGCSANSNNNPGADTSEADTDMDTGKDTETDDDSNKLYNGVVVTKTDRREDKTRLYNFTKVKKSRRWLKNLLMSDTSSDEDDLENDLSPEKLSDMMKLHLFHKQCQQKFYQDKDLQQYQYYSVGLLSNYDKFYEHQKMIVGPKKKAAKEQKRLEKKLMKARLKELKKKAQLEAKAEKAALSGMGPGRPSKTKKPTPEQLAARRRRLWVSLSKKEIPRAQKQKASARKEMLACLKKVAKEGQKESRRSALQSQKLMKEGVVRARRLSKEMMVYWKRFEKVEKEHRRKAEKEAQEQRKMDVEHREMKRQQRKLNFLITQTELYAHFMSRKLTGESNSDRDKILSRLDEEPEPDEPKTVKGGVLTDFLGADYDVEEVQNRVLKNAQDAYNAHQQKTKAFDKKMMHKSGMSGTEEAMDLANPTISDAAERPQASIFEGKLKGYQLKGMNWLANLYDQGINGILADEMGLGKTVQSIAFLAHLAEAQSIWGPFLVVAPASTLHNWQQEISRFLPKFKVVPYWGNTQDRKILRKFWNQDHLHTQDASFHVCVTSYQLVIQDHKYFQRIKWHYMILDEAQALKSTASVRWKILLEFNCRNRLLLTGTPIQNTMQELWALLHFIMPTLFDSHEEFNEWFSKDIEGHVENKCSIDENQLSRLHMILKPFMLRRVKKDVENELSDKIEILVYCPLTTRQKMLYKGIKMKISIEDLLQSATAASSHQAQSSTSSLMNLVMQFRKVCNHPELFERREISTPYYSVVPHYRVPKLVYREGLLDTATPSKQHWLYNKLYIYNPAHIHESLFPPQHKGSSVTVNSCFSFSRFTGQSPAEIFHIMFSGLVVRWLAIFVCLKEAYRIQHERDWHIRPTQTRYLNSRDLVLWPEAVTSAPNASVSPCLQELVFTRYTNRVYTHTRQVLHYIPETLAHRKIRFRRLSGKLEEGKAGFVSSRRSLHSPPSSPTKKTPLSPTRKSHGHAGHGSIKPPPHSPKDLDISSLPAHRHVLRSSRVQHCVATEMPAFLHYTLPKVYSSPRVAYSSDRSAAWDLIKQRLCGTLQARNSLLHGTPEITEQVKWRHLYFSPTTSEGLYGLRPKHGYSSVNVPGKETLVTDAGKLFVLDSLLLRLKSEGHRVLIYSQMTRMIDLLEEYMWHRKHTYMRLDGSSKISDRRDMVADFQSRSDIFAFLLSTRAGGLGINLTAADTVIFYDSDWNPTVDQQAMDRAHRLGQTKQVTVYRLICNGTIEERILQRAKEKSEIQRMVISGGNFRPDTLKPKEVVSLLLDDDEMEKKLKQKQEEKRHREEMGHRGPGRPPNKDKKRKPYQKTGRGPGRPPKKKKPENDHNLTIPAIIAQDLEASSYSLDSASAAASPQSVLSACSENTIQPLNIVDDSSNDGLVIVDDSLPATPTITPPPVKRGPGRPRGRPRGSGSGRRPRGRGSVQKALSAAEAAAAASAKSAAYAAYGYNFTGSATPGKGTTTPSKRGGHHGTPPRSASATPTHSTPSTPRASPRGFYAQRPGTPH